MGDMSKMPLTHYVAAHLSVLYSSVIPVFLSVSHYRVGLKGWALGCVNSCPPEARESQISRNLGLKLLLHELPVFSD